MVCLRVDHLPIAMQGWATLGCILCCHGGHGQLQSALSISAATPQRSGLTTKPLSSALHGVFEASMCVAMQAYV